MENNEETGAKKIIRFSLEDSEPGEDKEPELRGVLSYELKGGLILMTDCPLEPKHVVIFSEEINGCRSGVVRRVVVCGAEYMAHIDFR
jgi:hypothetical protein